MDANRSTEPKPIYDVISETIADIMKRANKTYEAAIPQRETAIATAFKQRIDFNVGDAVQVYSGKYAGRIGRIIGVKYSRNNGKKEMLTYTVKFSDVEAVQLPAGRLRFFTTTSDAEI